jgi:hypothetical protein
LKEKLLEAQLCYFKAGFYCCEKYIKLVNTSYSAVSVLTHSAHVLLLVGKGTAAVSKCTDAVSKGTDACKQRH